MEHSDNLILIDWLTFVSRCDSPDSIKDYLGIRDLDWEECEHGLMGYPKRYKCGHINILFGGSDDMGVCCTLSGQGCREFESFGHGNWRFLFELIHSQGSDVWLTRLDLAFDDRVGILDMDQLLDDTDAHNYTRRGKFWEVRYGSAGATIYHGAPDSETLCRIYDKAAERGCQDDTHWIRVELQLRGQNANGCVEKLLTMRTGDVFRGVLRNFLVYRVPSSDTNRSRWPVAPYWDRVLLGAQAISVYSAPGVEYNIFRLERYLVDQAGPSILCYAQIVGLDELLSQIKSKHMRISPKHQKLIYEFEMLKKGGVPDDEETD